jgi:hypothetical protein
MPTTDLLVFGLFVILALLALPTLRDLFSAVRQSVHDESGG